MKEIVFRAERRLKEKGFKTELSITEYPLHALHLAKESVKRSSIIIPAGGDGTINEVVNGVLSTEQEELPEIGIIPIGTGVDFVKTLGIKDVEDAIETILNGNFIESDVGSVIFRNNESEWKRFFINVLDAGLGGSVVNISKRLPKIMSGNTSFLISSLLGIMTFKPFNVKIYIDDELIEEARITIIGAANGRYFGGGMFIAPMAEINDGFLEFLYVKDTNIVKFITEVLLPVYDAKHLKYKNLFYRRGKKLKIIGEKNFLGEIDGEFFKAKEIEIKVEEKKLKIKTPFR